MKNVLFVVLLAVMLIGVSGCKSEKLLSQDASNLVATGYIESFIPASDGGEGYSYCSIIINPVGSQERLMFPHAIFAVNAIPKVLSSQKVYQLYVDNEHGYTIK